MENIKVIAELLVKFSLLDWIGLVWFLVCWIGIELIISYGWLGYANYEIGRASCRERV